MLFTAKHYSNLIKFIEESGMAKNPQKGSIVLKKLIEKFPNLKHILISISNYASSNIRKQINKSSLLKIIQNNNYFLCQNCGSKTVYSYVLKTFNSYCSKQCSSQYIRCTGLQKLKIIDNLFPFLKYKTPLKNFSGTERIKFRCTLCGSSDTDSPEVVLFKNYGCLCQKTFKPSKKFHRANKKRRLTNQQFIDTLPKLSNLKVIGTYINGRTKIKTECLSCNKVLYRLPQSIREDQKCFDCSKTTRHQHLRLDSIECENIIKISRPDIKQLTPYINHRTLIQVECLKCQHQFKTSYAAILGNTRCSKCYNSKRYSKISIKCLEEISKLLRVKIQHAENGGEFIIKTESNHYRIDGYNKRYNVIFEFHGNKYHGNPKVYKPNSKPNPYHPNITAKTLYNKTLEREKILKSKGYNVIAIWEQDYYYNRENLLRSILTKFNRIRNTI